MSALLEATDVHVRYGATRAVRGVSLRVEAREVWCLVGASGSGKSSLARALVGLVPLANGQVRVGGADIRHAPEAWWRRVVQPVFQDANAALDPRMTAGESISEAFRLLPATSTPMEVRIAESLAQVGLAPKVAARRPAALSAGQRQRVCIARALAVGPKVLVLDEPVSALDTTTQAHVLNLLMGLRAERGVAMIFITHDLAVAAHVADRLAVMADGEVVEVGSAETVLHAPTHPVTRALISSHPHLGV